MCYGRYIPPSTEVGRPVSVGWSKERKTIKLLLIGRSQIFRDQFCAGKIGTSFVGLPFVRTYHYGMVRYGVGGPYHTTRASHDSHTIPNAPFFIAVHHEFLEEHSLRNGRDR